MGKPSLSATGYLPQGRKAGCMPTGDIPQMRKPCRSLQGTVPDGGNPAATLHRPFPSWGYPAAPVKRFSQPNPFCLYHLHARFHLVSLWQTPCWLRSSVFQPQHSIFDIPLFASSPQRTPRSSPSTHKATQPLNRKSLIIIRCSMFDNRYSVFGVRHSL